jgi:RNA polymerase sigma-70 factor (ECF subfamily)
MKRPRHEDNELDDLSAWLADGYARAYRTAFLLVRDARDAEEAVQEAYLRVWRFRASLPAGPGREPWLYRVLVNTCYSFLRREVPRRQRNSGPTSELDDATAPEAAEHSPEAAAEASETADAVAVALADLPEHLRATVVLRYWTGLSEREIATAIARRPGTVRSRLHEARRRLAMDPRLGALAAPIAEEAR